MEKIECANSVFPEDKFSRLFLIELLFCVLFCILLPSLLSSVFSLVRDYIRHCTRFTFICIPPSLIWTISYFCVLQYGWKGNFTTNCHQNRCSWLLGWMHTAATQLPVAPSHLVYPLTHTPVEKKILQNTFKVTEQMGVLSPVKWTWWTEHCRANQETMQPGNTKIAEPITMEQSYNE